MATKLRTKLVVKLKTESMNMDIEYRKGTKLVNFIASLIRNYLTPEEMSELQSFISTLYDH